MVQIGDFMTLDGWESPPAAPWLTTALDQIGDRIFGKPCTTVGQGGGIPPLATLAHRYPLAQFVVTGAPGPDANVHGLDESLNLANAYKVTEAIAVLLEAHAQS
jgi:acetylornithine deacetylase/succinyl-diaminopimelate desuccinylase-like protein